MIKGKLKIGDEAYALELLSNVHGEDPRRPIRELVENAKDAEATSITVVINKRAADPYIMCRDDGRGMSLEALAKLPHDICHSIKRIEKKATGGVHGIGLLSFKTIGNRLRIVSRRVESPDTNAIEFQGLGSFEQISVERPLDAPGTEVYIYGIDKEKKLLNAERLAEYIGQEFEDDLWENKFKLDIQQNGTRISVTRERIAVGTPIISGRRISTEWGDIVVNVNYGGKMGVALTRRGITINRNLGNLPELEDDIWRSGKIGGSVRFDSINVSTDKKNPIRDTLFSTFIARMKELEPEIAEAIKNQEEVENEKSRERLHRYLARRLDEVLKNLHFGRIKALMQATKRAELEAEAQIAKGGAFGGEGSASARERIGKPPVSRGQTKKSLRSIYGITFEHERFLEHAGHRSRFEAKFGTVYINTAHPDYARKVLKKRNDLEELDYYYKCAVKEIVLHEFEGAPPMDVLEKLLDIQLAIEKNPPSI
jgi:virulence-associated protein VapD